MFNLNSLSRFGDQIALCHQETSESIESFTYRQIQCDATTVKNTLNEFREQTDGGTSECNHTWRQFSVVIAFAAHSPAILPAIIG